MSPSSIQRRSVSGPQASSLNVSTPPLPIRNGFCSLVARMCLTNSPPSSSQLSHSNPHHIAFSKSRPSIDLVHCSLIRSLCSFQSPFNVFICSISQLHRHMENSYPLSFDRFLCTVEFIWTDYVWISLEHYMFKGPGSFVFPLLHRCRSNLVLYFSKRPFILSSWFFNPRHCYNRSPLIHPRTLLGPFGKSVPFWMKPLSLVY